MTAHFPGLVASKEMYLIKKSLKIPMGYIEEQTTQWPKQRIQKDKQWSTKLTYKTKDRVTLTLLKTLSNIVITFFHLSCICLLRFVDAVSNITDQCHCKPDDYFPVCGSNQVTYHSPCYAGCLDTQRNGRVFIQS